jgi:hypothetical protein
MKKRKTNGGMDTRVEARTSGKNDGSIAPVNRETTEQPATLKTRQAIVADSLRELLGRGSDAQPPRNTHSPSSKQPNSDWSVPERPIAPSVVPDRHPFTEVLATVDNRHADVSVDEELGEREAEILVPPSLVPWMGRAVSSAKSNNPLTLTHERAIESARQMEPRGHGEVANTTLGHSKRPSIPSGLIALSSFRDLAESSSLALGVGRGSTSSVDSVASSSVTSETIDRQTRDHGTNESWHAGGLEIRVPTTDWPGMKRVNSGGVGAIERDFRGSRGPMFQSDEGLHMGRSFREGGNPGAFSVEQSDGLDLSRTNELLQQLLDEVRRGRQPFLPVNDRGSRL